MSRLRFVVFFATSVVLTLWLGARIAGVDRGADRYDLVASFDDATNLQVTDPVKLAGVPVGRVRSVTLVDGRAEVRFSVDRDVALPADTVVAVRSQDLLGRRLLRLEPGVASAMLGDGDRVSQTVSAVELGALINELGPLLEAVRPEQVNELVRALNVALDGRQESVAGITTDLATFLDTLASRSDTIASLVDDYGVLVAEVANRDRSIQTLIDNLVLLAETFDASDAVLTEALDTVPGVATDLRALLDANADHLDSLLADLDLIGADVRGQLDDVDAIAAGLPEALASLFSAFDDGEFVNINFNCVSSSPPPCPHPDAGDEQDDSSGLAELLEELLTP